MRWTFHGEELTVSFKRLMPGAYIVIGAALAGCGASPSPKLTAVAACQLLGDVESAGRSFLADSVVLPEDVEPRNGLALTTDAIITFNQSEGRVSAIDSAGNVRWTYGRTGDGPDEIAREFSTRISSMPGTQWVATDGRHIAFFDGRSFFGLSDEGALIGTWSADGLGAGRVGSARRIRSRGEKVFVDIEVMPRRGRGPGDSAAPRRLEIFESDSTETRLVGSLDLPALPVNAAGTIADGLAQAKPRWDLQGNCLVLNDGHSSRVVFVDIELGVTDTVDIGLPEWYIDVAKASGEMNGLTSVVMPEPTALARVGDLALAADGVLWVRPAAQSARTDKGQVVWRYAVQSGHLTQDTVVAFPRAADGVGGTYGITTDDSGRTTLRRVSITDNTRRQGVRAP